MAYCVKCGGYLDGQYREGEMLVCIHCSPTIPMYVSQETVIRQAENQPKESKSFASFLFYSLLVAVGLLTIIMLINLALDSDQPQTQNDARLEQETKTPSNVLISPTNQIISNRAIVENVPKKAKVVGRFAFGGASRRVPVENVVVQARINKEEFTTIIKNNGWYVANLPCGNSAEFYFGESLEFKTGKIEIPCKKTVEIGLWIWENGMFYDSDMKNIE